MDNQIYQLNKIAYHNSANCNFVSFDFTKDIHIAGRNGLGKTAKLNGVQIGYLPHSNFRSVDKKFNFDSDHSDEKAFDFYFPENNSYIIYEFSNPHGTFCQIIYKGQGDLELERAFLPVSYDVVLDWLWSFEDKTSIGKPTKIKRNQLIENIRLIKGHKIIKSKKEAEKMMYNSSLTDYELGKFSVASVDASRINNMVDILRLAANASKITKDMLKKIVVNLLKTGHQDNNRDALKYNPVELMEQFNQIKVDREILTKKQNFSPEYKSVTNDFIVLNKLLTEQGINYNLFYKSSSEMIVKSSEKLNSHIALITKKKDDVEENRKKGLVLRDTPTKLEGAITQLKKAQAQHVTIEEEFNTIVYGEDSGWGQYNGNIEQITEEIDLTIKHFTDELNALKDIDKTILQFNKDKKERIVMARKLANIELEIKNNSNLLISNEKIKHISGILKAINPAFSSTPDTLSDDEINKIIDFTTIFTTSENNKLMLSNIEFGDVTNKIKSISELRVDLNHAQSEINSLDAVISKNSKIIDNTDLKHKENLQKDLKDIKKERKVIEKYDAIKDSYELNKKEISSKESAYIKAQNLYNEHKKSYSTITSELKDLEASQKLYENENTKNIKLKSSLNVLKESNNYTYLSFDIDKSSLNLNVEQKNIDDLKKCFDNIRVNKSNIIKNLMTLVGENIIEDDNSLLQTSTKDYTKIENDLLSKLRIVYENITDDEDELERSFERQAKSILELSGDLKHHLDRYSSYIRKLNRELENVQLSSISSIKLNAEFHPRVERFIETIEAYGLSGDDAILAMEKGLEEQVRSFIMDMGLEKNKNMTVDVDTLIKGISLSYVNENNVENEKGSNGTSMITSVILISMFTREICGSHISILMPINLDEIASVDFSNIETVYKFIKTKGFSLFSASPTLPSSSIELFDVIIPLEDYEAVEDPEVFLSKYSMTYHHTMGGLIDNNTYIELDDEDFSHLSRETANVHN
jgi:hypothetical protein